ncbi:hypothetical protein Tcan_00766, partial [Toxocara canis]
GCTSSAPANDGASFFLSNVFNKLQCPGAFYVVCTFRVCKTPQWQQYRCMRVTIHEWMPFQNKILYDSSIQGRGQHKMITQSLDAIFNSLKQQLNSSSIRQCWMSNAELRENEQSIHDRTATTGEGS